MRKIVEIQFRLAALSILTAAVVLSSCKGGNIGVPGGGSDDGMSIQITDSVKVVASTYLLDSLPTSNSGTILLGQLSDADFGKTSVSSYMQLTPPSVDNMKVPEGAKFDSLSLVLKYSRYFYGDTSITQRILINRLEEDIILKKPGSGKEPEELPVFVNGSVLYSTSSFKYAAGCLGQIDFRPKPNSDDSLKVDLDKSFGAELFNLIVSKDKRITDKTEFLDYFKGIIIRSLKGNSMTGFNAENARMFLNYNYNDINGFPQKSRIEFSLRSKEYQFNHIDVDRRGTKISALNYNSPEIKSELTSQQLFIQGGTGLVAKLKIPGLTEFLKKPKIAINKMELIIETTPDAYKIYKAPPAMIMFIANSRNTPIEILTEPFSKTTQMAWFQRGNDAGSNGRYVFQLTEYADQIRKGLYKNTNLLLSLPVEDLLNTVNRLHVKGDKPELSIKTHIIFTNF